MNNELRTNKAFTIIELVVAVALLAITLGFAGVIFKVSINSQRTAGANAEIMQKLRAITDQLNADFKGLQKDGYLILHSEVSPGRREYRDSVSLGGFRTDRLYYFSVGDFQSWFPPYARSNIARIYFGHDRLSLYDPNVLVSQWNLARDVELLIQGIMPLPIDCNNISYAWFKANMGDTLNAANSLLSIPIDIQNDLDDVRSLMCQNVGKIIIEWTNGTSYYPNGSLVWFGFGTRRTRRDWDPLDTTVADAINETFIWPVYNATWNPVNSRYWPRALKFTFTLYDSKAILEQGRTFTHIVYLDN